MPRATCRVLSQLIVLLLLAATIGCAIQRHRAHIRDGLLIRGLHRDAFLAEWGYPERTSTMTGEEVISAGWSTYGGSFSKGKAVYDVWEYKDPDVILFFHRSRLVSWSTELTVEGLRRKENSRD